MFAYLTRSLLELYLTRLSLDIMCIEKWAGHIALDKLCTDIFFSHSSTKAKDKLLVFIRSTSDEYHNIYSCKEIRKIPTFLVKKKQKNCIIDFGSIDISGCSRILLYMYTKVYFSYDVSQFLTLKVPRKSASENVVCLCRLLNILADFSNLFLHTGKQCGP